MNASEVGSKDWWAVVRSMPWQEALIHLNDYRAELMEAKQGTAEYIKAAAYITRINAEIKRINITINDASYTKAMRQVLTDEQFQMVVQAKKELERESGGWQA